jgi:hypothetical protein
MGLSKVLYNPLKKGFSAADCAATELNGNTRDGAVNFTNIRTNTIQGQVHDEKAFYSMGGVSGHAGLFATAGDLAKLCQVMLNGGGYGGNKFFDKNTIDEFIKRKDSLPTWGLGWWREGDKGRPWYFGVDSSSDTIGHQGWTGTLTMIDPEKDLVVVLLTNKINSPVIDKNANPNDFSGNKFTTATLGTIPELIYEGIEHTSNDAVNANVAEMVDEKLKLYRQEAGKYDGKAILQAVYPLADTAVTWAEQKKTSDAVAYAKQAVAKLPKEADVSIVSRLKKRLSALATYESDTTCDVLVNRSYTFRVTSKNGKVPTFVVGTSGVFQSKLVLQKGNDYFFKITAIGKPGEAAGVYINGDAKHVVATIKAR